MKRSRSITLAWAVSAVTALLASSLTVPALAATSPAPASDRTSTAEARRVDQVPTPKLGWYDCSSFFGLGTECAEVALPRSYDAPNAATTTVAVLRIKATDPSHRIGSLFVNPGGPGGSGVQFAAAAQQWLSPQVRARFDIVGMDPRGTNFSDNVRCWPNSGVQQSDLAGLNVAIPLSDAEQQRAVTSAQAFGRACSTTGRPLSGAVSTAEVARDLDVLRRAVGDAKLSYLGFSYGSYLGTVYANLFPDRVRALAIDGVLDPVAWAGTQANAGTPQTARMRSGQGAVHAFDEILARCGKAGPQYCAFAAFGDPVQNYARLADRLKKQPLVFTDPGSGTTFTFGYGDLIANLLGALYAPFGSQIVDFILTDVWTLTSPTFTAAAQADAATDLGRRLAAGRAAASTYALPYNNGPEASQSVICTDSLNPADARRWPAYAAAEDRSAPGFGPIWTWLSAPCATRTWRVSDPGRYAGPFNRRTSAPVLVVGDYWDPATNYEGAVTVSRLLPNSYLLSNDSWGHTAYGTSACATSSVDSYLLSVSLPPRGTICVGDDQPFTIPIAGAPTARLAPARSLPPIDPIQPSGVIAIRS